MSRISSLDTGYTAGKLSVFPETLDDNDTLYVATNNAETKLKQSLSYSGKHIVADDISKFPEYGILKIESGNGNAGELIYYGSRNNNIFTQLIRGFAGSRQNTWEAGATISNSVAAEHHNATKDAVLQIETKLGTKNNPSATSLNGILQSLERKFLAPKPQHRAYPLIGPPPLKVRFQNISGGDAIRFLWDFGDGTTSIEKNPIHTYQQEGIYTVKLNIITSSGAQGVSVKNNYITVSNSEKPQFFYVKPTGSPREYLFVDQSDGNIRQRYWVFDDGETESISDPNIHSIKHTYDSAGSYRPSLLLIFNDQSLKRVFLNDILEVL